MVINKFTVRVKPYYGESLYSYMVRLSYKNGIDFIDLWRMVKVEHNNYDYARKSNVSMLNRFAVNAVDTKKLAYLSVLDEQDILKMTYYHIYKKFNDDNTTRARFFSEMIREELHYCPQCIHERAIHPLIWSIKGIKVCQLHGTTLLDKCHNCNKEVKLKDIVDLSLCPYCKNEFKLGCSVDLQDKKELQWQDWLHTSINTLQNSSKHTINSVDVAIRVLYILNKFNRAFDRKIVEESLENKELVATLLQRARNTMSYKRALSLFFLLSVLYNNQVSMSDFLELKVPDEFIDSIQTKTLNTNSEISCRAPWCKNYMKAGQLTKTGGAIHKYGDGEIRKNYLICLECGCEYAFDEYDELIERTYFIKVYETLTKHYKTHMTLQSLAKEIGLSAKSIRRSLCYFYSKGLFVDICNYDNLIRTNPILLNKFIEAVKLGEGINDIREWPVWKGENDFLFYRYNIDVIRELNMDTKDRLMTIEKQKEEKQELVLEILNDMINNDIDITNKSVSVRAGMCLESLRKWECDKLIAIKKERQREIKIQAYKEQIIFRASEFFHSHIKEAITAEELYMFLGIRRELLWKHSPEITAYLKDVCKNHNSKTYNTGIV